MQAIWGGYVASGGASRRRDSRWRGGRRRRSGRCYSRLGRGYRRRCAGCVRRFCLAAGRRLTTARGFRALAIPEIGHIPARPFQLKTGGSDLLLKMRLATRGAIGQHGIGNFLQHVFGKSAGLAAVGVYRHGGGISQRGARWGEARDYRLRTPKASALQKAQPDQHGHAKGANCKADGHVDHRLQKPVGAPLFGQQMVQELLRLRIGLDPRTALQVRVQKPR